MKPFLIRGNSEKVRVQRYSKYKIKSENLKTLIPLKKC